MPVTGGSAGELFRYTIVKYLAANPERKWGNNYEVRAKDTFVTSDLTTLGLRLIAFEQLMHLTTVQFDRIRFSTWEEDSVPYDPDVFASLPLAVTGSRSTSGGDQVALNVCLDVGRLPVSGRFGHIYIRGMLKDNEVYAPAGKYALVDPTSIATELADAVDDAALADYLDGTNPLFEIVMINKTGSQVRNVLSFQRRGVAVVPFDHAWFNRTTPP